jgi:hypothetical protein
MAFPTTSLLDALTAAALSANWTTGGVLGDAAAMTENSNGAFSSTGAGASAVWNPTVFGADQEAYATLHVLPAPTAFAQVWVRITNPPSATTTGYFLRVTPSTGVFNVRKKIAGGSSSSIGTFSQAVAAFDSFGLSVVGSTLTAWYKSGAGAWVSLGSFVDASIAGGGSVGFSVNDSTVRLTNFGGGTVVSNSDPRLLPNFPQTVIEIGFASNPGTAQASIVWTDVSDRCRGFSTSRGRKHELASFEAGTASITLQNRDRAFEPTYSGSPYYPNVVPLRPVRISEVWNGVTYRLFTGFVEEWPPSYNGPTDSEVTISCVDAFELLSQVALTVSYSQESSDVRIGHVLTSAGFPLADRILGSGDSDVEASTLTETAGLSHINDVVATELGRFFASGTGSAVFQNRTARFLPPYNTSQGTFGDGAGELPYVDHSVAFTKDEIRNDVTVTRDGGTGQEASDATSVGNYFTRSYAVSPLLTSDSEAASMATWLVSVYKDPKLRVTSVVLHPRMSPATLWPQALGREIGDRITINRRPPGGAGTNTGDHYIEGISHVAAKGSKGWTWTTQLFTSPVVQGTAWVIGTSTLNTTTVLVY